MYYYDFQNIVRRECIGHAGAILTPAKYVRVLDIL